MAKTLVTIALLPTDEAGKFVKDIGNLEVRDYCEVRVEFNDPALRREALCRVTLTAHSDDGEYFLRASLKDGMLHHWGWDRKFKLPEPAEPVPA
ncbi:hypothetical protein IT397_00555 [Candidatus Nomurabacteria bacterium]|nr:hypothetical protein [Candidatus Nomurabacteria bacterium]